MLPVDFPEATVKFAESQDEYETLPGHVSPGDEGVVTTCWRLTFWERVKILFGANLWLQQMTFNTPLQPQLPRIDRPTF